MKKGKSKNIVKEIELSVIIKAIAILLGSALIILIGLVYGFGDKVVIKKISTGLPFPAVIVGGNNIISTKEIAENLASIRMFYEKQDFSKVKMRVDFSTENGKKRLRLREKELINKLIEDRAIEILAKQEGIYITDKMVTDSVDRKLNEYGSEEIIKNSLNKLYGWSIDDFKKKIVKPNLYKDELEKWMNANIEQEKKKNSKDEIVKAKEELDSGVEFSDVTKEYSAGIMSKYGGEMGWFKKDYLVKELKNEVVVLNIGEISDILESKVGFHIIKLNDKKNIENETLYNLSQIFLPKMSFAKWLEEEIKNMKIRVLLKEYKWNANSGFIEFRDEQMQEFERKILNSPIDDPSLLGV